MERQEQVDNQAQYPWSTVVHLEVTFPEGKTSGSGVMVGPNDVLTAAHVVYNDELGGEATEVRVTPAYDPDSHEAPFGTVDASEWHYFPDWSVDTGNEGPGLGGTELDMAFLDLDEPLGNETGWMDLDPNFRKRCRQCDGLSWILRFQHDERFWARPGRHGRLVH
jgi:hypothetical protein